MGNWCTNMLRFGTTISVLSFSRVTRIKLDKEKITVISLRFIVSEYIIRWVEISTYIFDYLINKGKYHKPHVEASPMVETRASLKDPVYMASMTYDEHHYNNSYNGCNSRVFKHTQEKNIGHKRRLHYSNSISHHGLVSTHMNWLLELLILYHILLQRPLLTVWRK